MTVFSKAIFAEHYSALGAIDLWRPLYLRNKSIISYCKCVGIGGETGHSLWTL